MESKNKQDQKIIKTIMEVAPKHCENCGHKYKTEDFKIMRKSPVNTLLHLKCSNCGNTYMLNVVSPQNGMMGASRMPINLDLSSSQEFSKFAGGSSVEQDEALDIYELLDPDSFDDFIKDLN